MPRKIKRDSKSAQGKIIISDISAQSVVIRSAANSATVMAGDPTTDAPFPMSKLFDSIQEIIATRDYGNATDKEKIKFILEMTEQEVNKGESADFAKLKRWLRNISEIAPDIFEVIIAILNNPALRISSKISKLAQEILQEKQ